MATIAGQIARAVDATIQPEPSGVFVCAIVPNPEKPGTGKFHFSMRGFNYENLRLLALEINERADQLEAHG